MTKPLNKTESRLTIIRLKDSKEFLVRYMQLQISGELWVYTDGWLGVHIIGKDCKWKYSIKIT